MYIKDEGHKIGSGAAIAVTTTAGTTSLTPGTYWIQNPSSAVVHFNTLKTATTNDLTVPSSGEIPFPIIVEDKVYFIGESTGALRAILLP